MHGPVIAVLLEFDDIGAAVQVKAWSLSIWSINRMTAFALRHCNTIKMTKKPAGISGVSPKVLAIVSNLVWQAHPGYGAVTYVEHKPSHDDLATLASMRPLHFLRQ